MFPAEMADDCRRAFSRKPALKLHLSRDLASVAAATGVAAS